MHSTYYFCTYNLRFGSRASGKALHVLLCLRLANFQQKRCGSALRATFSRASGNALHVLPWYLKLAICQPELRECTSRTTCTYSLRCRASGHALHVLLYLTLANFQPELRECSSRTTLVLKTCALSAGAAGARFSYYFLHLQFAGVVLEQRKRTARTNARS